MNRIVTLEELVRDLISIGTRIGKEHGLTEEQITRMLYALASSIGNHNGFDKQ